MNRRGFFGFLSGAAIVPIAAIGIRAEASPIKPRISHNDLILLALIRLGAMVPGETPSVPTKKYCLMVIESMQCRGLEVNEITLARELSPLYRAQSVDSLDTSPHIR